MREARLWATLVSTPRGSWMTYQSEIGAARRSLEVAVADLEEAVGNRRKAEAANKASMSLNFLQNDVSVEQARAAAKRAAAEAAAETEKARALQQYAEQQEKEREKRWAAHIAAAEEQERLEKQRAEEQQASIRLARERRATGVPAPTPLLGRTQ